MRDRLLARSRAPMTRGWTRSEEHTSELQSLRHLVCRLLLEKKKANAIPPAYCNTHHDPPPRAVPGPETARAPPLSGHRVTKLPVVRCSPTAPDAAVVADG